MDDEVRVHTIELTTVEAAGILACVLATLQEDKPEGEFDMLSASLASAAKKLSVKLKVPIILAS